MATRCSNPECHNDLVNPYFHCKCGCNQFFCSKPCALSRWTGQKHLISLVSPATDLFVGVDINKLWKTKVVDDINSLVRKRLLRDVSAERLGIVVRDATTGQETINFDLAKQKMIDADPTQNKKFFAWILNGYARGGNRMFEDIDTNMKPTLTRYIALRDRKVIPPEKADITTYCGLYGCTTDKERQLPGLMNLVDEYYKVENISTEEERALISSGDAVLEFEDANIVVIRPKTVDAAKAFGKATKWCTAADKNNRFDSYNKDGPIFIIIPTPPVRTYDRERFQLQFDTGQFMDDANDPISNEAYSKYKNAIVFAFKTILPNHPDLVGRLSYFDFVNSGPKNEPCINGLRLMIDLGVDPNKVDEDGETFLFTLLSELSNWNLDFDDDDIIDIIDTSGIDVEKRNSLGETAIFHASGYNANIIDKLQNPLDVDAQDNDGDTTLHHASDEELIRALLMNGASRTIKNKDGETPMDTNGDLINYVIKTEGIELSDEEEEEEEDEEKKEDTDEESEDIEGSF